MDGKKGQTPENVRPYRLDYRPLIDRDLMDRAIRFIKRQARADKSFFVYLPYTATHFPTMPHPNFEGKSGKGLWGDPPILVSPNHVSTLSASAPGRV